MQNKLKASGSNTSIGVSTNAAATPLPIVAASTTAYVKGLYNVPSTNDKK